MKKHVLALAAAFVLCLGVPVLADHHEGGHKGGYDEEAMMEAWMKASMTGAEHEKLANMVGDWKTVTTHYEMGVAGEPSEGTASFTVQLGGRVVHGTHSGMMMGMPFEGISMDGYDNVTGQYWSTWMDTMTTAVYYMKGKDMGDHMSYKGIMNMPMGGEAKMRFDMTYEGDDKAVMKMFMSMPDMEEEMMTMVMEYHRISS